MKKVIFLVSSVLFVLGLYFSFDIAIKLIAFREYYFGRWNFLRVFVLYCLIILPILTLWFGLLLSKGKWREIKNYVQLLIVFVAIILVSWFTVFKWTSLLNMYGNYGSYVRQADQEDNLYLLGGKFIFPFLDNSASSFEKETIYREGIKYQYDVAFRKIWTFGSFVFVSAFLLLIVLPFRRD